MRLLFQLLLLASAFSAFGQKRYPLRVAEDSLRFKLELRGRQRVLAPQGETNLFKPKKDFPNVAAARLESADLVLDYQPAGGIGKLSYTFDIFIQTPDGQLITPRTGEVSDIADAKGRRLIWLDVTEQMDDFEGVYTLRVRRSLIGAVNCEAGRPTFTLRQKLPYYTAGGAGLALLGVGQIYRVQRDNQYERYTRLWAESNPAPAEDDNPLARAKSKDRAARICTWTGIGIVAIDALLFSRRHLKIKQKQRVYDKFCTPKTSLLLQPTLSPSSGWASATPTLGLRFTFR
jgi:hypothetical protein